MENEYDEIFVDEIIQRRLEILEKRQNSSDNNNNTYNQNHQFAYKNILVLPYVKNLSEQLKRYFKKLNIRTVFKGSNNISGLFSKIKDSDEPLNRSNLIYEIPCKTCNKKYIGQMEQLLKNRIAGHKCPTNSTALRDHMLEFDHAFDYENVKILEYEKTTFKREFKEMIQIAKNKECVNKRTDVNNLSRIYRNILDF